MVDEIFTDVFGETVVLTVQVRSNILQKHPEVNNFIDQLPQVLGDPDELRESTNDSRVVLYYQYQDDVLNGKWVVVVVKQIDRNYISTIYATDKIKSGTVIWQKRN
jgi:hypothetical protein